MILIKSRVYRNMASYRGAGLNMEAPDRIPIIHRVEGCDLVDTHRWHLENPCDFFHDTDTCKTMLPLAKVEEGHHGGFFILGRVAFKNFLDKLLVNFIEGERY